MGVMRGRRENDGGGGTNTVFLCIQSTTSSGKLLAPHSYEPYSPETEPSLAQNLNNVYPIQNQVQRGIAKRRRTRLKPQIDGNFPCDELIILLLLFQEHCHPSLDLCTPPWFAIVTHLIRHTLQGLACLTHTPWDCGRRRREVWGEEARQWKRETKCCSRRWERNNKLFEGQNHTRKRHKNKKEIYAQANSSVCENNNSHVLLLSMF